jgi:ligand-binding SRPBCC domain-containing protein
VEQTITPLVPYQKQKMHQLKTTIKLPITVKEAWNFFSDPNNLSTITPDKMGFTITSDFFKEEMYEGMIISYKVKPIAGISMNWMTEITHIKPKSFFVDEQRVGPYKIWHHQHHFKEIDGGCEMTDIVDYVAPMGFIGRAVEPFLIRPKLKEIFDYRERKMVELFGEFKA